MTVACDGEIVGRMRFDPDLLLAAPLLIFGAFALIGIATLLAFTRNWRRVLAGVLGAVVGYAVLGTELAYSLAEDARRHHQCPDAGWIGPAIGEIPGAILAVVAFELIRAACGPRTVQPPSASGAAAGK